jgi:predicted dehydrogenase
MPDSQLKTAVLGLDDTGMLLLDAASRLAHFQIVAVADTDGNLAEQTAARYNCAHYDDYRQLIIANQLDCLLVAAPIHTCAEYLKAAIKKKFNILKLPPLARNFAEAAELVRLADEQGVKFAVANTNRFTESFIDLEETLRQNDIEKVFLINAVCSVVGRQIPAWQTDPKLAGGGVLLNNSYQIIDAIIHNFGLPELVYSLNTNTAADRQQRLYLTEDTAIVTMKFSDTLLGNLTASRIFGEPRQSVTIYGKDRIIFVSPCDFIVTDPLGKVIKDTRYNQNLISDITGQLGNFALHILKPDSALRSASTLRSGNGNAAAAEDGSQSTSNNPLVSPARENLKVMAVIESAYLSARTSLPEQPNRILGIK